MRKSFPVFFALLLLAGAGIGWFLYDRYRIAPEPEFASFALTDLEGKPFDLKNWEGRPVLLNFWQTWCGPCIAEVPELEEAAAALKNEGFVFAMVSDEKTEKLQRAADQFGIDLLILQIPDLKDIGVYTYPTTLLYNSRGELVFKKVGVGEWSAEKTLEIFREKVL